jgi:hypothetical protein
MVLSIFSLSIKRNGVFKDIRLGAINLSIKHNQAYRVIRPRMSNLPLKRNVWRVVGDRVVCTLIISEPKFLFWLRLQRMMENRFGMFLGDLA